MWKYFETTPGFIREYFEMTSPTTINQIQMNMMLLGIIRSNHMYIDINILLYIY